ncbi:MAG: hypothetical protein Q4C53_09345 [Clostridia bacterium]|nr:hypothetical protein [Clostridia bacterium]
MKRSVVAIPAVALALSALPFAALAEGETPVAETPAVVAEAVMPAAEQGDDAPRPTMPDNPQGTTVDVPANEVMGDNKGTVGTNNGTVNANGGTVNANAGTVGENYGEVVTNTGTVGMNWQDCTVDTNEGTVGTNIGTVKENAGTVENNTSAGKVEENTGTVTKNEGEVVNKDGGTVGNNLNYVNQLGGTVTENAGQVDLNGGTVETNKENGTVYVIVPESSDAREAAENAVKDNYGTVEVLNPQGGGLLTTAGTFLGVQVKDDDTKTERYHDTNKLGVKKGDTLGVIAELFGNVRKGYVLIGCKNGSTAVDIDKAFIVNAPALLWLQWAEIAAPADPLRETKTERPADLDMLTGEAADDLARVFRGEVTEGVVSEEGDTYLMVASERNGKKVTMHLVIPADRLPGVSFESLRKMSLPKVLKLLKPWIPSAYFRTITLPNGKNAAKLGDYVSVVTAEDKGECFSFEFVVDTGVTPV